MDAIPNDESQEPNEVQEGYPISVGQVAEAFVMTENDILEQIEYEEEGFPPFLGPSFTVAQVPLVVVQEIIQNEDGEVLFRVKVVIANEEDEELLRKQFLVPESQLSAPDYSALLDYVAANLAAAKNNGLSVLQFESMIEQLLFSIGWEE